MITEDFQFSTFIVSTISLFLLLEDDRFDVYREKPWDFPRWTIFRNSSSLKEERKIQDVEIFRLSPCTIYIYQRTPTKLLSFRLIELDRSHRSPSLSDRPCSRSKRNAAICPRSIGGYNHKRLHPLPSRFRVYPEKHNQYLFICQLFPTNFPVNTPPSSKYKLKIRYIAQRPTPRDCNY